jgi:large conductance mechanosensitive channel
LNYGIFINSVVDFVIVALVIFLTLRAVKGMQRPQAEGAPSTKECPFCYSTIAVKATRCAHCTSQL